MSVTAPCRECGNDVHIAMWDDAVLAERISPRCGECHEETPEFNLWDAPECLDDDEAYFVGPSHWFDYDKYEDELVVEERSLTEKYSNLTDELLGDAPRHYSIIVRDPSDDDLVQEARDELISQRITDIRRNQP